MTLTRSSRSPGPRASVQQRRVLSLSLACFALAYFAITTPSVVRAQCVDYGGSFRFLGTGDLPDYGKDVAVYGGLAYVVSGVYCGSCVGRLDVYDLSTVGEPGGGPSNLGGIELPGGPATLAVLGERAYVGALGGQLHVVDVSDPSQPSLVTTVPEDVPHDLAADSGLLFAATDSGLHVYDIGNPDSPVRIGSRPFASAAKSIALSGTLAYVVWGGPRNTGSALSVVDVSEPTHPVVRSSIWSTAMLGAVAVSGSRAYLGGGFRYRDLDGFLDVVDVSDPLHPVLEGSLGNLMFPINGLAVNGDAVYATAADPWYFFGDFYVIDASDPEQPNLVHVDELEFQALGPCVADGIVYFCEDRVIGGLHFAIAPSDVRPKALAAIPWSVNIYSVDVQGDLAYLTDATPVLKLLDLSDPAAPQVIGNSSIPARAGAVEVQGNFAYLGYESHSLDVVDVTNPQLPQIVASVPQASGVVDIVADGPWLYTVGWSGMQTVDITNPRTPVAGGYLAIDGIAIAVDGDHAYVLDGYSFNIVDVADPAAPVLVGGLGAQAAGALALSGHYALLVDWLGVEIVDVADPALPVEVGRIDDIESLNASGIRVHGNYAYLSGDRMAVVDISDPLQPMVVGGTETQLNAWPRDLAAGEQFVLVAGENLRVFPIQCPSMNRVEPPALAAGLTMRVAPNPMRDETRLKLDIDPALTGGARIPVTVWVMDAAGRHVARLDDEPLGAGTHLLRWGGRRDRDGRPAPAGVYWLKVDAAGMTSRTARIVRLRGE